MYSEAQLEMVEVRKQVLQQGMIIKRYKKLVGDLQGKISGFEGQPSGQPRSINSSFE